MAALFSIGGLSKLVWDHPFEVVAGVCGVTLIFVRIFYSESLEERDDSLVYTSSVAEKQRQRVVSKLRGRCSKGQYRVSKNPILNGKGVDCRGSSKKYQTALTSDSSTEESEGESTASDSEPEKYSESKSQKSRSSSNARVIRDSFLKLPINKPTKTSSSNYLDKTARKHPPSLHKVVTAPSLLISEGALKV